MSICPLTSFLPAWEAWCDLGQLALPSNNLLRARSHHIPRPAFPLFPDPALARRKNPGCGGGGGARPPVMHLSVAAAAALAAGGTLAPGLAQRWRRGWRRGRDGAAAVAAAVAAPREAGQFVRGSRSARVLLRSALLRFAQPPLPPPPPPPPPSHRSPRAPSTARDCLAAVFRKEHKQNRQAVLRPVKLRVKLSDIYHSTFESRITAGRDPKSFAPDATQGERGQRVGLGRAGERAWAVPGAAAAGSREARRGEARPSSNSRRHLLRAPPGPAAGAAVEAARRPGPPLPPPPPPPPSLARPLFDMPNSALLCITGNSWHKYACSAVQPDAKRIDLPARGYRFAPLSGGGSVQEGSRRSSSRAAVFIAAGSRPRGGGGGEQLRGVAWRGGGVGHTPGAWAGAALPRPGILGDGGGGTALVATEAVAEGMVVLWRSLKKTTINHCST
ncbi:Protein of unknown function [Gryllus bimaculatus]|nr:Protein of unknown function [Gryllus bimaculatus]